MRHLIPLYRKFSKFYSLSFLFTYQTVSSLQYVLQKIFKPKLSFTLSKYLGEIRSPFFLCVLCFVLLSVFLYPALSIAESSEAVQKDNVIRIGFQEERGFYSSPGTVGQEGYGYEYLEKILYYTKKEYIPIYISVNWNDGLEMLKRGELDILPFAAYTEDRKNDFIATTHQLTWEKPILLSLKEENPQINYDYRELQGVKICVYDHNIYHDEFLAFMQENNINPQVVKIPYKTIAELKKDAEYDYILSTSLLLGYDIAYTVALKSRPSYIIAHKNNQELIDELDDALEKLETENFLFNQKLALKYFHYLDKKKEQLTAQEEALIQDKIYNVGLMNMNAPISFQTDDGKFAGVIVDVVNRLAKLGGFKVEYHELPQNASDDIINSFDFGILPYKKHYIGRFPTSNTYGSTPFILLTSKDFKSDKKHLIGTLEHFQLNYKFVSTFLGGENEEYIEFNSTPDLIKAFNSGRINCAILTRAIYNTVHTYFAENSITDLGIAYSLPISFSEKFPKEKIKIINKLITHIEQATIDDFTMRNGALMTSHSASFYVKKYWYFGALAFLAMGGIFFIIYRKAQKQKAFELQLAKDVTPLTGLFTFQKFLEEATHFIKKNKNRELQIIIIDIDHFSYINEVFSFEVGSQVLQRVGYHIKEILPEIFPIANYGGDKFCFLCYKISPTPKAIIESLNLPVLKKSLDSLLGKHANLSLSIGVYEIIEKDLDLDHMIDCAQIAANESKALFGTHAKFYEEGMKQESISQNQMLNLVKIALEEEEFELFYQPKFDIDKMHVVGAEALIRWFKDGKMIPPDDFIPIVEKNGLIGELDYYVIEMVCKFLSAHKNEKLPHISINVSGFTIIKSELVDKIVEITNKYKIKPREIDIEITESALVYNFDMAIKQILALRGLGFTISMDDFGTGVSSLNRLSQMPLDTIKLDRVFIMNALENTKSSVIVQTVIELAKRIGAKTVAEGIETREQLELLRNLSCEHGQGYFYARPMPASNFLEYLHKSDNKDVE